MLVTNMRSEHELCQCELWGASCLSVGAIWLKSATLTESVKLTILYVGSCYCTSSSIFAIYFACAVKYCMLYDVVCCKILSISGKCADLSEQRQISRQA